MKIFITSILILLFHFNICGQEVQDTLTKQKKITTKFGFSYALLTSRQINQTLNEPFDLISIQSPKFHGATSQLSLIALVEKNIFFIKNGLSYSHILTRIYSKHKPFYVNPNSYFNNEYDRIRDYSYKTLDYAIAFGFKQKNILLSMGVYVGYILSNELTISGPNGPINSNISLIVDDRYMYGVDFELNYSILNKMFVGIGSRISKSISENASVINEYNSLSIKINLGIYIIKK